jgi:hypothetical protein
MKEGQLTGMSTDFVNQHEAIAVRGSAEGYTSYPRYMHLAKGREKIFIDQATTRTSETFQRNPPLISRGRL